jgi:hypothetical protein
MQPTILIISFLIQFFIFLIDGKSNSFLRTTHSLDAGNENTDITYEYTPSDYVHYGHEFTHSSFSYDTSYFYQMSIIPAIVLGVGTLILLIMFFSSFKCCKYSICRSYANPKSVFFEADMTCITMLYLLLTLFTIAMTQVIFNLGSVLVDRSGPLLSTQFESLGKNFTSSDVIIVDLTGNSLAEQYQASLLSCNSSRLTGYADNITYFSSSLASLADSSDVVSSELNTVIDYLDSYFDSSTNFNYSSLVMYFTWLLPLCIGILHFIARHFFRVDVEDVSSTFMKTLFGCSSLSFLYCLFLGVFLFLLIIGGGDFCMDPSTVLVNDLPLKDLSFSPSILVNISAYYSSCNSAKPSFLQIYGKNSYNSLLSLNETVDFLLTAPAISNVNCPTDMNVQDMQQSLLTIFNGLDDVNQQLDCFPMQSLWLTDIIFKSLCTDFYEGSFWIWSSLLILAFLHLCLIGISIFFWDAQVALVKEAEEEEKEAVIMAAERKAEKEVKEDETQGSGIRRGSIVLPKKSKVSPASPTTIADGKKMSKDKKQLHKERRERRETRHQKHAEAHGHHHHHHHRKVVPVKDSNGNSNGGEKDSSGGKKKKHAINRISFGVERLSHLVTKGPSFMNKNPNSSAAILKNIKKSKINFLNNLFKKTTSTSSSEFPKIGIKLSYLVKTFIPKYLKGKGWKDKDGKQQQHLLSLTTGDICTKIIKKVSGKTSFIEYLFRKEKNINDLDIATIYICHTWQYSFLEVINTLIHHFTSSTDASNHTNLDVFVWFDIFCMNQHHHSTVFSRFPGWWNGTFPQGIREIGHTIVIASPWEHPLLLTRTWCLFEIYFTLSTQTKLDIIIQKEQEHTVTHMVTKGKANALEEVMNRILSTISLERSEVSLSEDKMKILEVFRRLEGGIAGVEEIIMKGIREAILQNALRIVDQQEKKITQNNHDDHLPAF